MTNKQKSINSTSLFDTLLVVLILCLQFASQTATAGWSQFQGNAQHTGFVESDLRATSLKPLWTIDAPPYSAQPGDRSVAIVDGDVYATILSGYGFSGPYILNRIDGNDGKIKWQIPISAYSHSGVSAPSVDGGVVYVHHWGHSSNPSSPSELPSLMGFDANDGSQLFVTPHSGQWESGSRPTIAGDRVFAAGGYYGGLDSYHLDGNHQWFHQVNQQYGWIPAADDEKVYVYMGEASASPGPGTGSLYIVDRDSGARTSTILHPQSGGSFYGASQSVVLGGMDDAFAQTYSSNFSNILVRFNISNNDISWQLSSNFSGVPAVGNGMVFIPDGSRLRVLDQATGNDLWNWQGGSVFGNVVLTDNYAFVTAGSSVHAIDITTHQSVWNSSGITGSIALENQLLVISNPNGVYAFSVPEPGALHLMMISICGLALSRTKTESHR